MSRPSKTHAATIAWERGQIARATHFVAYLFNGRFNKHVSDPISTFVAARAVADRMDRELATGARRSIVYAITPEGWSIQVSDDNALSLGRPADQP